MADGDGEEGNECFVIMPISDPAEYRSGHFKEVYESILGPAVEDAGFAPWRADQANASEFIQIDILNRLLHAPMAICDLSAHNPNVLFELGLRQAFDKPVALVREIGTAPIFDIGPFRYAEYRPECIASEALEDRVKIGKSVRETFAAGPESVNSIVRLLAVTHRAFLPTVSVSPESAKLDVILEELRVSRAQIQRIDRRHQAEALIADAKSLYDSTSEYGTDGRRVFEQPARDLARELSAISDFAGLDLRSKLEMKRATDRLLSLFDETD